MPVKGAPAGSLGRKLAKRQSAYRQSFNGPDGREVLADLAIFCRALAPTYVPGDTHAQMHLEGRREVFLRILDHLNLDLEEIYGLVDEP